MCKAHSHKVVSAGFPGVMHVRIVRDRGSGQSRGFGFVVSLGCSLVQGSCPNSIGTESYFAGSRRTAS